MTRLQEQIETTLPIDDVFAFIADFANSMVWDPGTATSERIDAGPVGVGARYRLGVRMRGKRGADGVPHHDLRAAAPGRPHTATAPASRRWTRSASSRLGPAPGSTTPPTSAWAAGCGSSSRSLGGAFAKIAHDALDGMQRALDARAAQREAATAGDRRSRPADDGAVHEGRRRRVRRQRAHRRLRAAPGRPPVRLYEGEATAGGHVATVTVDTAAARSRGHRVHRLQRAHLPATSSGCSRSSGSRRSPATCRSARPAGPATWSSARAGTWLLRPARPRACARRTCGCSRTSCASTGDARSVLDSPAPTGMTLGEYLDDRGFGAAFRDHFLVPITAAVWSTAPGRDARVPGGLPAPLPGQPRPHRPRQGPPVADRDRRVAHLRRPAASRCRRSRCGRATPVVGVTRDEAGVTIRTAGGDRGAVRRRGHGDPRRRRAGGSCATRTTRSGPPWAASSTTATRWCSTPTSASCRAGTTHGRRGTWTRRPATRPAASVTMTYHMNRLQSLPGPTQYFISVNPGDAGPRRPGDPGPRVQPPAVHVPVAPGPRRRSASSRATGPPGTRAPTSATGSTRTAAGPGTRPRRSCAPRGAGRRRAIGRGHASRCSAMRSHLLEGKLRHRRSNPIDYALEHSVYYAALDLAELDEVTRSARLIGRNRRNVLEFRDADHWTRPPPTSARPSSPTCASRARTRRAGGSCWSRTCGSWATSSTRPASTCAGTRTASSASSSSRSTTRTSSGTSTRSGPRRRPGVSRRVDGEGLLRLAVHRHGGRVRRARADDPASLRIAINEGTAETQLHTSLVLRRVRLTDRVVARCWSATPSSPRGRSRPSTCTRGACGARVPGSTVTARQPGSTGRRRGASAVALATRVTSTPEGLQPSHKTSIATCGGTQPVADMIWCGSRHSPAARPLTDL